MLPAFIDKEVLRRSLPLAYACDVLGIRLNENDEAQCPFHDDSRPSFNLWTDADGVERWGCFPCGDQGDVFDLIRRMEGRSFPEALERAEQMLAEVPDGYERRAEARGRPLDQDSAVTVHHGLVKAASEPGWVCVLSGLVSGDSDVEVRKSYDTVLRDGLRWGVDPNGNVLMPHYDGAGQLTGVKVRAYDGRRWSLSGSSFTALYGSWLPRQTRYLLICEGETDAGWARCQRPPVDVLGLPSGAGYFNSAWTAVEADIIFLAFDADDAGLNATRTWLEEFDGRDIRVCRLPRGHDLKSARPDITTMLRHAVRPIESTSQIFVQDNRWQRQTNQGPRIVTNWYAEPKARLDPADSDLEPALEVEVHANGLTWLDTMTASDVHTGLKLRSWSGKRSLDCMASDTDAQQLASHLLAESIALPEVFQTARVGAHTPPERYRYAGRSVVTPSASIGSLPWRYVGPGDVASHIHLDDNGPIDWDWLRALLELNESSVITPLLAWLVAATRRDQVTHFPTLFLGGSSGSGKTTTARLAQRIVGSTIAHSLASITQFALIRALCGTTTFPVLIDEWSLQSREDARSTIQSVLPIIYEGGVTTRGRSDLSVVEYKLTSPVLLAGEDAFHLDREVERMIALRMRRTAQGGRALQRLVDQPVERIGRWLYDWQVRQPDSLPPVPTVQLDRPTYNRKILEMGWATLNAFLADAQEHDTRDIPELPELDLTQLDEPAVERENEYEAFMLELSGLRDRDGMPLVWADPNGRGTWARFRALTSQHNLGRLDVELPGRSRAMKQYFADHYELLEERTGVDFIQHPIRATLIVGFDLDTL